MLDDTRPGTALPQELASLENAAIARWAAAGLAPRWLALLQTTDVEVAHLGGGLLAVTAGKKIILSDDAAGLGWFFDPTPNDDGEYAPTARDRVLSALSGSAAAGKFDLLTVLEHELGHVLGLPDDDGTGLMAEKLATGPRRSV